MYSFFLFFFWFFLHSPKIARKHHAMTLICSLLFKSSYHHQKPLKGSRLFSLMANTIWSTNQNLRHVQEGNPTHLLLKTFLNPLLEIEQVDETKAPWLPNRPQEVLAHGLRCTDQYLEWPCISNDWRSNLDCWSQQSCCWQTRLWTVIKDLGVDMTNFYNQYKSIERKNKRPNFLFWDWVAGFWNGFWVWTQKKRKTNWKRKRKRSRGCLVCIFK